MGIYGQKTGFRADLIQNPGGIYTAGGAESGTRSSALGNNFLPAANNVTAGYVQSFYINNEPDWEDISISRDYYPYVLAVKKNGTLWAWGYNAWGQLGNGTRDNYVSPIQIGSLTNWKQVSCDASFVMAVKTDGTLWAWGRNNHGQLGIQNIIDYSSPVQVGLLTNWKQVATTQTRQWAAIKTDGTLWTCGYNYSTFGAPIGNGTNSNYYSSPVQVGSLTNWKQVEGGSIRFHAVKTDGTLWAWGGNANWELGLNIYVQYYSYSSPVQVGSLTNWSKISRRTDGIMYAIKTDGTLWGWGNSLSGSGGIGNGLYVSPVQVGSANDWKDVSSGYGASYVSGNYVYTLAIKNNGSLWSWGYNKDGAGFLGVTNTIYSNPIQVGTSTSWKLISCGYQIAAIASNQDKSNKSLLYGWGYNNVGQLGVGTTTNSSFPNIVPSSAGWKTLESGNFHTVAISNIGTLWSWGQNTKGQLGNGTTTNYSSPIQIGSLTNWKQVACGDDYTAAIKTDGTLWTWGWNNRGQLGNGTTIDFSSPIQIGSLTNWKQVACGYDHTLAVKTDGTLWGCGYNGNGQLGNGTVTPYSSPIQIGLLTNWSQVRAGRAFSAAVKTDGTLWTWGWNSEGQLGNGTSLTNYSSPIQIGLLTNWKQIACGYRSAAAIKTDGTLWTWGRNNYGELGNGTTISYSSPIQVGSLTNWKQVNTGSELTLAVKIDDTLWIWGSNIYGRLGNNTFLNYSSPIQIGTLSNWSEVFRSRYSAFALSDISQDLGQRYVSKDYLLDVYPNIASATGARTSPGLWAWGSNITGQLGNGTTIRYSSPIQIGSLTNWKQVSIGDQCILAIKTDGTLWSWGYGQNGQLGNGPVGNGYSSPIQVGSLTDWKNIYSHKGSSVSFAIKTDGTLWGWGQSGKGVLGNQVSTTITYNSPIQISALTNWKQVAGGFHTAAIKTDGTLWTWGNGNFGALGNGTTINYSSPIQIGSLTNWKQVAACGYNTFAIKTDGTLWSVGYNTRGQLGNGTTVNYSSPIQVGSLTNWKQVDCGEYYAAAVKTDGTLWSWGTNSIGHLGNGTTVYYSSPIQIGSLTNWKQVICGQLHTAAIKTDGTLWTWGWNIHGQLGNGTTTNYSSPIQIGSLTNWKQIACSETNTAAIADGYY